MNGRPLALKLSGAVIYALDGIHSSPVVVRFRPDTVDELARLFAVAGKHLLAYLVLFYSG